MMHSIIRKITFIMKIFFVICIFQSWPHHTVLSSPTAQSKLPSFIKVCHQSDPKLNECIKDAVEQLRPHLADGIPELSVPPCEPLTIPEVIMNQGRGTVNIQSTYKNIKINGPSQFVLRSVKVDLERDRLKIKLWLPYLRMISDYTIQGRIIMLPISGSGVNRGNYTDIEVTTLIQGERIAKEGKTYFNVVYVRVDFNIGHASIHFSNLFNGDKELGDSMNAFLNDNWKNVAEDMKPILEETISELVKRFSNKIYHKYSLEELLPL